MHAAQTERAVAVWEIAGVRNSSVEYVIDEPTEEPWPGHDNRSDRAEVAAYLSEAVWSGLETRLRVASAEMHDGEPTILVERIPSRDWRTAWHEHFPLARIPAARPIVVRPPHIAYEPKMGEVVVDLVPGLAFGTGQHQSSRLCLRLLSDQVRGGERVLDVGTGSGILAVAAAKLGARSVLATDIDPLAIGAARRTARRNLLADVVRVRETSVPPDERFDLISANLTADILQDLAADLAGALEPGGSLIASGLINARVDQVRSALEGAGLRLETVVREDDWRAMLLIGVEWSPGGRGTAVDVDCAAADEAGGVGC